MSMIRVNYDNARAQARQLEQSEQECARIVQGLQTLQRQLAELWEGEAAQAYAQALAKRIQAARGIQDEIGRLAAMIRRAADEFEAAEQKTKANMAAERMAPILAEKSPIWQAERSRQRMHSKMQAMRTL